MSLRFSSFIAAVLLVGCGSCGAQQSDAAGGAEETDETPQAKTGTVIGTVRLAEGAEVPSYPDPATETQPSRPGVCPPMADDGRSPVRLTDEGTLANVVVAAAGFEGAAPPHEPATHEVTIEDCALRPSVLAATRGDQLKIVNGTDYPFMPVVGQAAMVQALLQGQSRTMPLDMGGVRTITCTFAAPCGRSDVVVVHHPVHAVTDDDGRFRIENVPAGQPVEIGAWHPLFEERTATVEVAAGETEEIELVIAPAPSAAAAAEGAPADAEGVGEEGEAAQEGEEGHPEDDSDTLF